MKSFDTRLSPGDHAGASPSSFDDVVVGSPMNRGRQVLLAFESGDSAALTAASKEKRAVLVPPPTDKKEVEPLKSATLLQAPSLSPRLAGPTAMHPQAFPPERRLHRRHTAPSSLTLAESLDKGTQAEVALAQEMQAVQALSNGRMASRPDLLAPIASEHAVRPPKVCFESVTKMPGRGAKEHRDWCFDLDRSLSQGLPQLERSSTGPFMRPPAATERSNTASFRRPASSLTPAPSSSVPARRKHMAPSEQIPFHITPRIKVTEMLEDISNSSFTRRHHLNNSVGGESVLEALQRAPLGSTDEDTATGTVPHGQHEPGLAAAYLGSTRPPDDSPANGLRWLPSPRGAAASAEVEFDVPGVDAAVTFLQRSPLFRDTDAADLEALVRRGTMRQVPRYKIIIREGSKAGRNIYLLLSGKCASHSQRLHTRGVHIRVTRVQPGAPTRTALAQRPAFAH